MLNNASITISSTNIVVGTLNFISIANDNFPTLSNTIVYVDGIVARIVSHQNNKIHFICPVGVNTGPIDVFVFDKVNKISSAKVTINVLYKEVYFDNVAETTSISRFKQGALKTLSVYSRDLSYTNFTEINDATSVVQNVLSIVLTRKGERLFNPQFGTRIYEMIFSIVSIPAVLEAELLAEIKFQVEKYEPRARIIVDRSMVHFDSNANAIYVILMIEVPGGSTKELGITLSGVRK